MFAYLGKRVSRSHCSTFHHKSERFKAEIIGIDMLQQMSTLSVRKTHFCEIKLQERTDE